MLNWYYHLPDMLLAAASYLVLARLLLSPFPIGNSAVVRTLSALTAPVVAPVAAITPRLVPPPVVLLAVVAWLYAARIILRAGFAATGLRLG
ncbi:MAG TPA: hypothetical protein VFR19_02565 [Hyphomicrobiaceae bacterium]|jgi:hypothetical protein|nr:hypothetical protein [Hyphomicrobiaceae bacterium]